MINPFVRSSLSVALLLMRLGGGEKEGEGVKGGISIIWRCELLEWIYQSLMYSVKHSNVSIDLIAELDMHVHVFKFIHYSNL